MQLGSRQDFELASPVVSVRPLRYSPLKIIIVAAAVIAAGLLLSLRSSRWSALLLLAVAFGLIYLGVSGHALLLSLFYSFQAEDEEEIDKYAINDLSYRTEQEQSQQIRKTQHTFIGKVHFVRDGIKYFHFKEELYKVERGVVSAVTEADILAIF